MLRFIKFALPVLVVPALIACSTITTGTTQPITIKTAKVDGAKCELVDSKEGRWVVSETPQTVEITKGDGPLNVTCSKAGYKSSTVVVEEVLAGMTAGNILLGGGIGIIVDAASGAAQEYPDEVLVWLEPNTFVSAEAKEAWFAEKNAYEAKMAAEKEQDKQRSEPEGEGGYN